MTYTAKTMQTYFPNGQAKGIRMARINTEVVEAIIVPRNQVLQGAKEIEELQEVGLYFLFGENEEKMKTEVYIGETENCFERFKTHNKEKDFWDVAIAFVTHGKWTKADVRFLEHYAFQKAKENDRFYVNQNVPTGSHIEKWRKSDLYKLFDTIQFLLTALGYPVFETLRKEVKKEEENQEIFYCKGRGVTATGELTDEGFVVFKGSEMAKDPVKSFETGSRHHLRRIQSMIEDKTIMLQGDTFVFQKDHLFNSPSMAADCVMQRSSNGWKEWKNNKGQTLEEIKRK